MTGVRELFARRRGFFADWFKARSRVYLGGAATEGRLKSAGLERYRYVHLATHGLVDEEHPALSKLLLAPEPGSPEDSVLYLGESYGLHLNADLVVLSACDTGRGRVARGEGIIGFTRGFLYAGAESLLVSLWPVGDAASSQLVVDFYRELLAGRPKAQALRQAKLRTLGRNPSTPSPTTGRRSSSSASDAEARRRPFVPRSRGRARGGRGAAAGTTSSRRSSGPGAERYERSSRSTKSACRLRW